MSIFFIELLGWIGAALLLLAYFLLVHHDLDRSSWKFHVLNLLGSIFLAVNAYSNKAFPSFGISLVWCLIALYGLSFMKKTAK